MQFPQLYAIMCSNILEGRDKLLTGKQRSVLRAIGNKLEPIVTIGKSGITENLIIQLDEALTARELVKLRVLPHQDFDVARIASDLAQRTESEIVQMIGRNIIFYRATRDGSPSKIDWEREC